MKNLILVHLESVSELILNTNLKLFPNISKIIQESSYYKNYYSSATSTLMVISDLCYGGMYREKCTRLESNFNKIGNYNTLFDELEMRGYRTKGIIWPRIVTYGKMVNGHIFGRNMKIDAMESYEKFIENIENNIKTEEPFALFVANFASHISYRGTEEAKNRNSYEKWKEGYQKIDDTCGKIFDLLKKTGKEKDTIVVLYGDHGDDYWGHRLHNGYTHAIEPYSSIIHTPLIIWDMEGEKKTEYKLTSCLDVKTKIMDLLFDEENENSRQYIFSRNIFANQKNDVMSLSKGYAVANEEYILLVSIRGLELYNMDMDPANTCNLLEFFSMDSEGKITYCSNYTDIRSMHFRDFFTDKEIRHLKQVYRQLRKDLLYETQKIYEEAEKSVKERDRELNFKRINRSHYFNMYNKAFIDKIEKWFDNITFMR